MKKRQFIAALAVTTTAFAVPSLSHAFDAMTLKVASNYPSTSLFSRVQQFYTDQITKKTEGKVTFEWFYGSALLKATDVFPGISRGVVDMGYSVPAAFNPREYPVSDITLPFITTNPGAASMAFAEWYQNTPAVQKEFKKNNVHLLLTLPAAENVLWSMNKVQKADDLKGMRIRTLLGPGQAFTMLGATAVTVPYTDAIDLMSRGGVDAISTTPFEQGVMDGLHDMVKYLSPAADMGIFATVMTGINLNRWESFSPDLQKIFTDSAQEALMFYIDEQSKEVDKAVETLLNSQVEVVPLDPAEAQSWKDATRDQITNAYSEKVERVGANGQELIDSFTVLVRKYEDQSPYTTGIDRYMQRKGAN